MKNKNILLISENKKAKEFFSKKLLLLRNSDDIEVSNIERIENYDIKFTPNVIILDLAGKEDVAESEIRFCKDSFKDVYLIIFSEISTPEFIANMYDLGIDDYILPQSTQADFLIKIVNAIKQTSLRKISSRNKNLLKSLDVISSESGFYTERCANELMAQALTQLTDGMFMIVTYDELDRARFSLTTLQNAIKSSVRSSDLVIEVKSSKFYILLPSTDEKGGIAVFEKIKAKLEEKFRIKAGLEKVTSRDFRYIEQKASAALSDAMLSANDYCVYTEKEETQDENIPQIKVEQVKKDFKLFQQKFNKKLAGVITPVFFRLQRVFEDELPQTKIEQSTDEMQCIFHLKSIQQTSRLTLVYAGLGKVVIYITHSGLDSPENREIIIPLKDLTEKSLSDIICSFIDEYKSCIEPQGEKNERSRSK